MELFRLLGTIAIENSDANSAIDDTTGRASNSSSVMSDAFKKVGTAIVTYLSASKIIEFTGSCVKSAADAEAMASQFTQVFGDMESSAASSLSEIANSTGIVENRMKGSYTQIAAFAKTTGMDTKDALDLTNRAMVAVADSAAFYDRSLEDTTESLQSFLKGNFENDAALGLSCTETTRNAAANALYGKSFQELSESQKQLTLLQMVEDANKLSGAMGQASRESDTWTNQTGNLKQAWADLQSVIGKPVLKAIIPIVKSLSDYLQGLGDDVGGVGELFAATLEMSKPLLDLFIELLPTVINLAIAFIPLIQVLAQMLNDIMPYLTVAIKKFSDLLSNTTTLQVKNFTKGFSRIIEFTKESIQQAKNLITNGLNIINGIVKTFTFILKGDWKGAFEGIKQTTSGVLGIIKGYIDSFASIIKLIFGNISVDIDGKWNSMLDGIKNATNACVDVVRGIVDRMKALMDFTFNVPKIKLPHFKITPDGWKLDDLLKGSTPKLGIDWYANGGIMTKPTAFGINGSNVMVGGEAGAEAIAPIDTLKGYVSEAVASQNEELVEILERILNAIVNSDDELLGKMVTALESMQFTINNREFARLVRQVN